MSLRKLFFIYLLLLIIAAVFPHTTIKSVRIENLHVEIRLDYLIHVCLYLPCMFLIQKGIIRRPANSFLIGIVIGISLEGIQLFLSYRTFNINDLLANIIGLFLGSLFLLPVFSQRILKLKFIKCQV